MEAFSLKRLPVQDKFALKVEQAVVVVVMCAYAVGLAKVEQVERFLLGLVMEEQKDHWVVV